MTTFIATDGTCITYDTAPTTKAIVELFEFICELERRAGDPVRESPVCVAGRAPREEVLATTVAHSDVPLQVAATVDVKGTWTTEGDFIPADGKCDVVA